MSVQFKPVALATMAHFAWRGAFVVAGMLIFRLRSPHDFAVFQFFNITAIGLASYASLGLGQAAARFFAASDGRVREERLGHASMILLVGFTLSLVAAAAAFGVAGIMLGDAIAFKAQFSLLAAIYLYAGVIDGGMVGLRRFHWLLFSNTIGAVILLASFFLYADSLSLSNVIWLFCLAPLITLFSNTAVLLGLVKPWRTPMLTMHDHKKVLKEVFGFSLPLFLSGFIFVSVPWVYGRTLQGSSELVTAFAHFSIGLQWFSLILLIPSMVTRVVAPQVFSEIDDGRAARNLLIGRASINAVVATCIAILLVPLSPFVLTLYGNEAAASQTDLMVMSIAAIFASTVGVVGTYVIAVRGASRWFVLMLIWGVCAAGMLFWLLSLGAMVFSLGYLVAYAVLCALAWWSVVTIPIEPA